MHGILPVLDLVANKYLENGKIMLITDRVYRSRAEIRFLSEMLLSRHLENNEDLKRIVKILVEERFSHNYLISKKEAKEVLKLNIREISEDLEENIMDLFSHYDSILKLGSPLNYELELDGNNSKTCTFHRCFVESIELTHTYTTIRSVDKKMVSGQSGNEISYQSTLRQEEWISNNGV